MSQQNHPNNCGCRLVSLPDCQSLPSMYWFEFLNLSKTVDSVANSHHHKNRYLCKWQRLVSMSVLNCCVGLLFEQSEHSLTHWLTGPRIETSKTAKILYDKLLQYLQSFIFGQLPRQSGQDLAKCFPQERRSAWSNWPSISNLIVRFVFLSLSSFSTLQNI